MIARAAGFIARTGPATEQDRWEENAGLTPSTLAPVVAALVVAAEHLPEPAATYCLELADDWNASIEDWTYARGTRLASEHGVDGHYVRIASPDVLAGAPISTPVPVRNRPPEIVDGRRATRWSGRTSWRSCGSGSASPTTRGSCRASRSPMLSCGPRRRAGRSGIATTATATASTRTGAPSTGPGSAAGWPLLVGERGHYELDAGRDARPYLEAMRRMASDGGMLPEQVWDVAPIPERHLAPGRPSGSAMPLAWAHAEYVKLVRSIALGHSIDRPEAAWRRYRGMPPTATRATWRFTAPRPSMPAGRTLRLEVMAPARVRYSINSRQPGPISTPGTRASVCGWPTSPARTGWRPAGPSTSRSGGRRPAAGRGPGCTSRSGQRPDRPSNSGAGLLPPGGPGTGQQPRRTPRGLGWRWAG